MHHCCLNIWHKLPLTLSSPSAHCQSENRKRSHWVWAQLLSVLMELPSAQGHGCVQWIPPGFQCTSCRSYPLICPAHAAVGPVSCLVLPAGTPFWHMPQQAQLFLSLGYFHCLYWELQSPGLIPLHKTPLASSWRGSRLPVFRQAIFGEPGRGLGWQWHSSRVAQSEPALGAGRERWQCPPGVSAMAAARAVWQEGSVSGAGGARLTGASLVALRTLLQFGASVDVTCRFAVCGHTWVELQHLWANDKF